jgi:hypothetical protein
MIELYIVLGAAVIIGAVAIIRLDLIVREITGELKEKIRRLENRQ